MINTKRQAPVSTATLPMLMHAIAESTADLDSVAEVVSRDHGLASRVLGLANSVQYGMSRSVTDLPMAMGLIGTSMVQTLAIASAATLLDEQDTMAHAQRHAIEVAVAARLVAPMADVRPSDAFAAGLLHDIGELLLLQAEPTAYARLYPTFTGHLHQLRVEKQTFGTDHALIGAEHLLEWRLPDRIADAVADHHDPFHLSDPTTIVVAAADELLDDAGRHHALDLLEIDAEAAHHLRRLVERETGELLGLLCA